MKFRILIVDDVEQNIHSLKMAIEDSFDIDVYSALSAQEGMAILMEHTIDLILTDIQMPDIDGFEFAEYLKGIERTKNIPVIFITGVYDNLNFQKKGYDLGAVEYITKPIDTNILNSKLKIFMDIFAKQKEKQKEINDKNQMLIYQSKMASMGEMIGVIAHQLKQPLNVLSLFCNDVKDSYKHNEINDEFIEDFNIQTNQQIKYMSETIDGFREFFNPNKDKENFLLKTSINKSINLVEKLLAKNSISIDLQVGEEKVFGIKDELEQVIINLITNAQDAFIENKINDKKIIIKTETIQNNVVLSVEDNAGGIPGDIINNIFDPYFTTKEKGTGTGLYMVNLIITTSFQGEIKVYNTQNNGVKFVIMFPIC